MLEPAASWSLTLYRSFPLMSQTLSQLPELRWTQLSAHGLSPHALCLSSSDSSWCLGWCVAFGETTLRTSLIYVCHLRSWSSLPAFPTNRQNQKLKTSQTVFHHQEEIDHTISGSAAESWKKTPWLLWETVDRLWCCLCFWARALEISVAERLHDLDRNFIDSLGVWGWGTHEKTSSPLTVRSSNSSSRFSDPINDEELSFQSEWNPPSIFSSDLQKNNQNDDWS